jgi:hypothetical protein
MEGSSFSIDVAAIPDGARQKMKQGPVTESYGQRPEEDEHADDIVGLLAP